VLVVQALQLPSKQHVAVVHVNQPQEEESGHGHHSLERVRQRRAHITVFKHKLGLNDLTNDAQRSEYYQENVRGLDLAGHLEMQPRLRISRVLALALHDKGPVQLNRGKENQR
jgi:hypothetical protein